MKISYRWLKEFVDVDLGPREVADRLVNAGIEVASIEPVVEGVSGVVIGEIEAIEQELGESRPGHVNRLCRVALPDRRLSVICGAPNAVPGLRSALAPPGATLPGGREIKVATIHGVVSEGMLCSEKELGLGPDDRGILALPADAPLGADLATYLGLDDVILEIEITPNRPDALSVVGVAREVAALTGAPFRFPQVAVKEARPRGVGPRVRGDRGGRPLPAVLRAGHHGLDRPSVAALAGAASARRRPSADQQPGRCHELRDVGAGPAPARVRR